MSTYEPGEWRWPSGVVYTVQPEILARLERGREYRILVSVRRTATVSGDSTGYADLYRLATALTDARVAALAHDEPLTRWIEWQGWRSVEFGDRQLIFAFIGTLVRAGGDALDGERPPSEAELALPGGASPEMLTQRGRQRVDEFYNDFDHRLGGDIAGEDSVFSYGEYVPSSEGIDFTPFVQRALAMTRRHYCGASIVRHDCFCATDPSVAVVHVYFRT